MAEVSIAVHADSQPDFTTSEAATIAKLRSELGPEASHLVLAHDLAAILRGAGRKLWAAMLMWFG